MDINVEQIIREYLPQIIHMSLATSKDGMPWVCEVHFAYDDDLNLYFRSKPSRRHSQEIAANPRVAGNIVKQHERSDYPLGVYFEGTAEMLTDDAQIVHASDCIVDRLGIKADLIAEAKLEDGHKFYKISVENYYVFGKLGDSAGGQKYQLNWAKSR